MDGSRRAEIGTFATGNPGDSGLPGYLPNPAQGNFGVYGRLSWSLDAKPQRMDCTQLYKLELEKKRLEVELLRQQVEIAKQGMREADRQLDEAANELPPATRTAGGGGPPL